MSRSQALAPKPDIPDEILARWQEIANLTAEIVEVSAALINRLEPEHIEVLAASSKAGNPYKPGDRESLEMGPYCAALMFEQSMILIPDAREDPAWCRSYALEQGMISYLGFPLHWPDGDLFGTICVMDSRKNEFAAKYQRLLATLRNLIASDLRSLLQAVEKVQTADARIKESQAKFATAFHESPVPMVISTLEAGRLIEVNRAFEQVIGYAAEEVVGRRALEIGLWSDPGDREHWVSELRKHGTVRDMELCFRNKSGEQVCCNTTTSVVMIGSERCLLTAAEDITERRRVEEQLRGEKERAQRYLDIAETFLLALDRDGHINLINRKGCDLLGYVETELLGRNWFELCLPGEDCVPVQAVFESLMSGDKEPAEQYENFVLTKEGERRLVLWHNTLMHDEQGRITGTLSSGEDITEHRQAEDALRASERKFRAVFDQSLQLTGLLSLDGTVLEVNKSALDLVGIEAGDVVGKPFWDTPWWSHSPEEQERLRAAFKRAAAGEAVHFDAVHLDSKGHKREIDAYLGPFTDDNGEVTGVIPVGFDITELKRAEREVLASREALRALAAELSTVEERERRRIATNLHDRLGQALAVLRMKFGSLTTASDEKESSQLIAEIRDLLENAIEDTSTLTFDLSPPILYELGVEAAIEWAGEKLCNEHELSFEFSDDGRPKPLEEDAGPLLYRCARELMINVVKHAEASRLKVKVGCDGDVVSIAVEDDGAGFVPPESGEGVSSSSFGLYSIQERIKHLGGTFQIESKPGGGTRAEVNAPIKGSAS